MCIAVMVDADGEIPKPSMTNGFTEFDFVPEEIVGC